EDCAALGDGLWLRYTTDEAETVIGVGLLPYGDVIHDPDRYEVFLCDSTVLGTNASAVDVASSCGTQLATCNASLGATTLQTCTGWGGSSVSANFALRITRTGGQQPKLLERLISELVCL
ncbi:hypothetical protein CYMTET_36352, partial [Cymbomonas tetramitiformis]